MQRTKKLFLIWSRLTTAMFLWLLRSLNKRWINKHITACHGLHEFCFMSLYIIQEIAIVFILNGEKMNEFSILMGKFHCSRQNTLAHFCDAVLFAVSPHREKRAGSILSRHRLNPATSKGCLAKLLPAHSVEAAENSPPQISPWFHRWPKLPEILYQRDMETRYSDTGPAELGK